MTRIDTAIRRIEAAFERRDRAQAVLRARHETLRGEVAQAIDAIDQMTAKDDN